jgi:fibro-slime domain-containing protein
MEWFSPDMTGNDLWVHVPDYVVWASDYMTNRCRSDFNCDGTVLCMGDIGISFEPHYMHECSHGGDACPAWPVFTGTYFKIPNSHPNTGIGVDGCKVAGLVNSTLGPNGLPVVSSFGASYRGPSGPITDANALGEILWWSTTSPYGVLYEKTQADAFPLSFSGFFPDGEGDDCYYHRAVHWHGTFLGCYWERNRFTLASDDDAWLFIDGVLALDNGGVSQGKCVWTDVNLGTEVRQHTFDLFYIDRHRFGAGLKFSSDYWPDDYPCSISTGDVPCPLTACCDGMDNDGDGCIDYPGDRGCSSPSDNSEGEAGCAACSDGIDNDLDGYTDYPADPGCACPQDTSEGDVTSVGELPSGARPALRIYQNCPNPFASQTAITFSVPQTGKVRLSVYDISGRLVKVLVEGEIIAGEYTAVWDGLRSSGLPASPGIYLCRLSTPESTVERKMVVVR